MLQSLKKKSIGLLAALALTAATSATAQNQVYDAIVAQDGSGQYNSIQAAIDASPDNSTSPWKILVKNGSYNEQVFIPKNKRYIHLIGQDKEQTIIHYDLNVGGKPSGNEKPEQLKYWVSSVHNPEGSTYKMKGSVVVIDAPDFYTENISYVNDFGVDNQSGPQALALQTNTDRMAFNNCKFRSFQDTWMTTRNDADRHYVKDCWIEGAVDYFYGGGNALVETSTLYNVRRGSVIVAPCHEKASFGYVFRDCVVDGNKAAADGRTALGRPWHNNPKAVYINTTFSIPISPKGWTDMGTVPEIFAEYNSRDKEGNPVDMSKRKSEYKRRSDNSIGSCPTTITRERADSCTYENIILADDNWNPRAFMEKLPSPQGVKLKKSTLRWGKTADAIGYIVIVNGHITTITDKPSCQLAPEATGTIEICPVNRYGSLGHKASIVL